MSIAAECQLWPPVYCDFHGAVMKPLWSHYGAAIEPHLSGQACYSSSDLSLA